MRRQASRAKAIAEELQRIIDQDTFLDEWLVQSDQVRLEFERETELFDATAREAYASRFGFRTWAAPRECQRDTHRAAALFRSEPAFRTLWKLLKQHDAKLAWGPMLYGPHNAGVPAKLLSAIETWHKTPKFTDAELTRHKAKIARKCKELGELLAQLTPGNFGDQFDRLLFEPMEADRLFDCLGTPKKRINAYGSSTYFRARNAEYLLRDAGVTPQWALRSIAKSAQEREFDVLPTKVRAPTAYRTYLIGEVSTSLSGYGQAEDTLVSDRLIAEVVSLLSNMDCSEDDVRHALKQRREIQRTSAVEDSERKLL